MKWTKILLVFALCGTASFAQKVKQIEPAPLMPVSSTALVYRAALTQTGVTDPVADVLEKQPGINIKWIRIAKGVYEGTQIGAWPAGRVKTRISNGNQTDFITSAYVDSGAIWVETRHVNLFQSDADCPYVLCYKDQGLADSLIDIFIY